MSADTSRLWPDPNPWLEPVAPRSPRDPFLIAADLFDPPALKDEHGPPWTLEPHQMPPAGVPGPVRVMRSFCS